MSSEKLQTGRMPRRPFFARYLSRTALLGFALALFTAGLATAGVLWTPGLVRYLSARGASPTAIATVYGVAYVLPMLLGAVAVWMGIHSLHVIERTGGRTTGDGPAIFAIMIGLFACLIAAITTFANLIWPHLPSVLGP